MAGLHCCSFCKPEVTVDGQDVKLKDLPLTELLPEGYEHVLCSYKDVDENKFEATITLSIYTAEELKRWKDAFEQTTKSTYRLKRTYPNVGKKILFKGNYHCQHRGSGKRSKGILVSKATQCLSAMSLTLFNIPINYRGANPHIPEFPARVDLTWTHNHPVFAASALRHRDVGQAAQDMLIDFFKDGLSPSCALEALHKILEDEPNYATIKDDRHFVPDFPFVNRLFNKHVTSLHGKFTETVTFDEVIEHVKSLDTKANSHIAGDDFIIALVTPLMERVHRLVPQSGEIIFMDANGGMDRSGAQVMMLMTHTPFGGLPLGSILLTSLKAEHITKGLFMLFELLGEQAFYGRGKNGPSVFMTDHCELEREAIKAVFPSSTLLFCAFHILQAFWRCLWDKKSVVKKDERPHIFNLMKGLLYAANPRELEERFSNICQSRIVTAYPTILEYFKTYWAIKEDWALALCQDMLGRGSNRNNIVESCIRIFKDRILVRRKCFNVVQLLNFTVAFISKFYSRKLHQLITISGSSAASSSSKRARTKGAEIARDEVSHIEVATYKVLNHYVDTSIGTCTCCYGSSGTACKHQFAVEHHFGENHVASMPVPDEAEKLRYLEVATGEKSVQNEPLDSSQTACVDLTAAISDLEDDDIPGPSSGERDTQIQNFQDRFRSVCAQVEQLVLSDPDTLLEPANVFISRLQELLTSKTSLANALTNFDSALPTRILLGFIQPQPTATAPGKFKSSCSRRQKADPSRSKRKRKTVFPDVPSMLPVHKKANNHIP